MKLAAFFCVLCMFAVYSAQSAPVDTDSKTHYTEQSPPSAGGEGKP